MRNFRHKLRKTDVYKDESPYNDKDEDKEEDEDKDAFKDYNYLNKNLWESFVKAVDNEGWKLVNKKRMVCRDEINEFVERTLKVFIALLGDLEDKLTNEVTKRL